MASRTSSRRDAAAADGRSSVASELEAIFAPLPRLEPTVEPAASRQPAAPRGRRLRAWIICLAVVALAALVASLVFLRPIAHQPPPRGTTKAAVPAVPILPPAINATPKPAVPSLPQARAKPIMAPVPRAAAPQAHHRRCARFASQAWCLHGTIAAADNELRKAYEAAVRAGVDRDTLVDIRHDWKRLRGRANRDPQALIRGYRLLSQQLRAEMRRRGR